jgi:hypothetical protein
VKDSLSSFKKLILVVFGVALRLDALERGDSGVFLYQLHILMPRSGSGIRNQESGIRNQESGIRDQKGRT